MCILFILYRYDRFLNDNLIGEIYIKLKMQIKKFKHTLGLVKYIAVLLCVFVISVFASVGYFSHNQENKAITYKHDNTVNMNVVHKPVIGENESTGVTDSDIVIKSSSTEEVVEDIAFDTVYVEDNTLFKGESEVAVEGRNGHLKKIYDVKYEDGKEVSRTLVSQVRTEPVNKIIAVGTKVCFTDSRGGFGSYTYSYKMAATAYAPTPENWGYGTASGNRARDGVVAVDPRIIPLGTKLYVKSNVEGIPDYGYCIAWDVGGAIKNMRIDLFMESERDCYYFGLRDVTVYVLEDQSIDVFSMRNFLETFSKIEWGY